MKSGFFILLFVTIFLSSCKKDSSANVAPPANVNLVTNSSFETYDNQIAYDGWVGTVHIFDSLGIIHPPIVKDAPVGGGLWCLQLIPQWFPLEGFSETIITSQAGKNIYKLSVWMKTVGDGGLFSLQQWRSGSMISNKKVTDTTSVWKQFSFTDTLTVLATDTLKVHLSAGSSEACSRTIYFDLIKLEKIETSILNNKNPYPTSH